MITLVTTLLDPDRYPKSELANLYLSRWQIETNLRHLKTTMGLEVLHCKTVEGVLKELYMFAVAYNLVRLVMLEASRRQKVPLERVSFVDALRWLRDADSTTKLTPLVVNPARLNRLEPRVKKRRPKEYDLMNKPRNILRKALPRKKDKA
ncbi:MAG: transposase [Planctomycetes bacterium]|nr:transposase [Planctomycetota bacterium]